jgi:hypothetical protein
VPIECYYLHMTYSLQNGYTESVTGKCFELRHKQPEAGNYVLFGNVYVDNVDVSGHTALIQEISKDGIMVHGYFYCVCGDRGLHLHRKEAWVEWEHLHESVFRTERFD